MVPTTFFTQPCYGFSPAGMHLRLKGLAITLPVQIPYDHRVGDEDTCSGSGDRWIWGLNLGISSHALLGGGYQDLILHGHGSLQDGLCLGKCPEAVASSDNRWPIQSRCL